MNAPATTTQTAQNGQLIPAQTDVAIGFGSSRSFDLMQRVAKLFASSSLVPQQYQGNIANCVIALNMAQRIGAEPMQVMQNLYVVHGRPGWSAKFLIATFNQCGRFSAIKYEWVGKEGTDSWGCRAYAVERESGEKIVGPLITIKLAKDEGWYNKSGSKWKTIPQLMLMYRAGAWLINTAAPELSMGLSSREELEDIDDLPTVRVTQAGRDPGSLEQLEAELTGGAAGGTDEARAADDGSCFTAQEVHDRLIAAEDADALNEAADLIRTLPESERAVLDELYEQRALVLAGG